MKNIQYIMNTLVACKKELSTLMPMQEAFIRHEFEILRKGKVYGNEQLNVRIRIELR